MGIHSVSEEFWHAQDAGGFVLHCHDLLVVRESAMSTKMDGYVLQSVISTVNPGPPFWSVVTALGILHLHLSILP